MFSLSGNSLRHPKANWARQFNKSTLVILSQPTGSSQYQNPLSAPKAQENSMTSTWYDSSRRRNAQRCRRRTMRPHPENRAPPSARFPLRPTGGIATRMKCSKTTTPISRSRTQKPNTPVDRELRFPATKAPDNCPGASVFRHAYSTTSCAA